jgi:hypothetical protein
VAGVGGLIVLGDVLTLTALAQQAPAMVLGAVALFLALWGYRQARRADTLVEARLSVSQVRQGERLGKLTTAVELLDMRRLIVEEELTDLGVRLSYWPPDGRKYASRPARGDASAGPPEHDDHRADDDDPAGYGPPETEARRIPVPPLPPHDAIPRHRRSAP